MRRRLRGREFGRRLRSDTLRDAPSTADEAASLASDIAALEVPGGGTGHEVADARIRDWWPDALNLLKKLNVGHDPKRTQQDVLWKF